MKIDEYDLERTRELFERIERDHHREPRGRLRMPRQVPQSPVRQREGSKP
jgi:hypothetical protein